MAPAKRLNLSKSKAEESSASSSEAEERSVVSEQEEQSEEDDEEEESDEEFEIPSGFEPVKGSSAITRDAVLSEDKELWFFKLPKHLDASALANVSFKVGKSAELGAAVASVTREGKQYQLQNEDALLTQQLVNAFPLSSDRKKFSLAKPFARVFSLVEARSSSVDAVTAKSSSSSKREAPVVDAETGKSSKKSKKSKGDDEREKAKVAKKAKSKK